MANVGGDTKETANLRRREFFFIFYESCINEDRVVRSTFRGLWHLDPYPLEIEGSSKRPLDYTQSTREILDINLV